MAITLHEIGKYLEIVHCEFSINEKDESLYANMSDGMEKGVVIISTPENGDIFSLTMRPLMEEAFFLNIPEDHPNLLKVLKEFLSANYETKFGSWEYDPRSGDVKFTIEFPIEEGTITEKQFRRILSGVSTAFEFQLIFKHILEKGTVPRT